MPSNIEIKARMTISHERAIEIALEVSKTHIPEINTLTQEDIFFNCPNGRLKLRREQRDDVETAMLIAYERPDTTGPKRSDYVKTIVPQPDEMEEILERSLGVKERVSKTRLLAIMERDGLKSRIHLDTVEGLGEFIEFEVMIDDDHSVEKGEELAKFLCEAFQIKDEDHVDGAYVDSILAKSNVA